MKVLLIQPSSPYISEAIPLGLGYIAAILEKNKCKVRIIDMTAAYSKYKDDDIINIAKDYDVIGLYLMTTHVKRAYKLIEKLRPLNKTIIAGGPHATVMPNEALNNGIDIIFHGECENSIKEFIKSEKLERINGISYKKDKIVHNPQRSDFVNLDKLPFPAKDLFNIDDFAKSKKEIKNAMSTVLSSRGCPGQCIFCSKIVSGNRYRFRSAKNLINEISELKEKYCVDNFLIVDDTLNIHKKRFIEICELMKKNNIKWRCNARLDFLDQELLSLMKDSGCTYITYGIESGDPEVLKRIKKGFNLEKIRRIVKLTHKIGILQTVNFMVGFPFETAKNIQNTINLIKELEPYYDNIQRGGILIPFPGTEVYENYKNECGFENWWLKTDRFLKEVHEAKRRPLYKRIFFEDLDLLGKHGFFNYRPAVKRKIKKTIRIINKIIIKKRAKKLNPTDSDLIGFIIEISIFLIFYSSVILYKISPFLENKIVQGFYFIARKSRFYK